MSDRPRLAGAWAHPPNLEFKMLPERLIGAHAASVSVAAAGVMLVSAIDGALATVGAVMVCADARLDNPQELARTLGLSSQSRDAEIIAAGWHQRGPAILDDLEGDFAFAVWDGDKLFLVRDAMGQRPLHVWKRHGVLYFASLPLDFCVLDEFEAQPDLARLAALLDFMPELGPASFVAGVDRIQPGHLLVAGESRQRRWWSPQLEPLSIGFDDAVEAVRYELDRAVASQGQTDRPILAAQLSGGLDSSAVVATAANVIPGKTGILAITGTSAGAHQNVPPTYFVDEAAVAAETAAMLKGVTHRTAMAEPECPVLAFRRWNGQVQRPVLNPENLHWLDATYRAAAEAGAAVLLEAVFGNFTISNNGLDRLGDLARRMRLVTLLREIRLYSAQSNSSRLGALRHAISPLTPPWLFGTIDRLMGRTPPMAIPGSFLRFRDAPVSRPPAATAVGAQRQLLGLAFADMGPIRASVLAVHGIQTRDPTSARRLVELCLRLPAETYFGNGVSRRLGKALVSGRVAPRVYQELRRGYQGSTWPAGDPGTRARMREEVEAIRTDAALADFFDVERMAEAVDDPRESQHLGLIRALSAANFARALPLRAAKLRR